MDDLTRLNDHFASLGLFPSRADVVAHGSRFREGNAASLAPIALHDAYDLVFHNGIGGVGKRCAGHDAHALSVADLSLVEASRRNLRNHVELNRRIGSCACKLRGPHGEAVHGRMIERCYVDVAGQILCRNAPDHLEHAHFLHIQKLDM